MLSVDVPLNTMLADLDESLRGLLKGELERHGFEGIEIAFDAPTREWSGQLSSPAVNLFLYDLRESDEHRPSGWTKQRVGDEFVEAPPPMVMEVSYAITAWAQAVEDEHRLLSQVLSLLYAFPTLPDDMLNGRLRNGSQAMSIRARVGQAKGDKADFWTAVGGQYKASLDYVVRLSVESGVRRQIPQVRTQTIRTRLLDAPRRALPLRPSRGRDAPSQGACGGRPRDQRGARGPRRPARSRARRQDGGRPPEPRARMTERAAEDARKALAGTSARPGG